MEKASGQLVVRDVSWEPEMRSGGRRGRAGRGGHGAGQVPRGGRALPPSGWGDGLWGICRQLRGRGWEDGVEGLMVMW